MLMFTLLALLAVPSDRIPTAAKPVVDCDSGFWLRFDPIGSAPGAPAERPQSPAFELSECAMKATHVLVVDRRGLVVEVWKGEAAIGDRLPIDRILCSVLPTKMESPFDSVLARTEPLSCWQDQLHARGRFILFLVKSSTPLPPLPAWTALDEIRVNKQCYPQSCCIEVGYFSRDEAKEQRVNQAIRDGWLPACREGWFACSMAYVDDFGWVRTRQLVLDRPSGFGNRTNSSLLVPTWCVVGTEVEFKKEVAERCFHPFGCY